MRDKGSSIKKELDEEVLEIIRRKIAKQTPTGSKRKKGKVMKIPCPLLK